MSTTKVVRYTTAVMPGARLKKERMCFHMKSLKSNKGFTLIELVVVIAILGILAGIAIPRFMDATATARGAKIVADLRTIDSAAMMYQAKTGNLATSSGDLVTGTQSTSYLAAWPTPPTGKAIVHCNDGKDHALTSTSARTYVFNATSSRGTMGDLTVDGILALTGDDKK